MTKLKSTCDTGLRVSDRTSVSDHARTAVRTERERWTQHPSAESTGRKISYWVAALCRPSLCRPDMDKTGVLSPEDTGSF